jgi:DNA-binding PadR family transcriptional regulator
MVLSQNDRDLLLPLKPAVFAILMVLASGETHGYRIKKEVEKRSDGRIRVEPGSLYRILGKLLDDGFVVESEREPASPAGERRRYYSLSELGREVLGGEATRLASLIAEARDMNLISP